MSSKVFLVSLALMLLSILIAPVMAIGPEHALQEVGKNPNANNSGSYWAIETPSHVLVSWDPSGRIMIWRNANPNLGIMNNVAYIIDTGLKMTYYAQHTTEFEGKWVYWSGEYLGGTWSSPLVPAEGIHGAIYWLHRALGFSPAESLEKAMERPYGAYSHFHFVG
jgi:hypothetical protein